MKIERICQNDLCEKHFFAKQSDVKRGWALYCSKSCKAIQQMKKDTKVNLFSRKEFTENLYRKQLYEWDNDDYEKALKLPSLQEATNFMIKSV